MNLNNRVEDDERVTRYIFNRGEIGRNSQPHYVKGRAFEPRSDQLETSVWRTSSYSESEIWEEGKRQHATRPQNKHFFGRADLKATAIRKLDLDAIPDEPPKWHALIVGWPTEKEYWMSKAQLLAAEAAFQYNPEHQD